MHFRLHTHRQIQWPLHNQATAATSQYLSAWAKEAPGRNTAKKFRKWYEQPKRGFKTNRKGNQDTAEEKKEQTQTALQEVNKKREEQLGPFSLSMKQELDSMKLEGAKYHKGTLVGNYVYELLQPKSIKAISMSEAEDHEYRLHIGLNISNLWTLQIVGFFFFTSTLCVSFNFFQPLFGFEHITSSTINLCTCASMLSFQRNSCPNCFCYRCHTFSIGSEIINS